MGRAVEAVWERHGALDPAHAEDWEAAREWATAQQERALAKEGGGDGGGRQAGSAPRPGGRVRRTRQSRSRGECALPRERAGRRR